MRIATPAFCALLTISAFHATGAVAEDDGLILPTSPASSVAYTIGEGPSGLSPDTIIKVFVGPVEACCEGKSPIAGRYRQDGDRVTFVPSFAFLEGQSYTVETWRGDLEEFVIAPRIAANAPEVLAIYPSGGEIPENTLRFYIQFSAPMMPHQSDAFISLRDENGVPDNDAFMRFSQELWNENRTRLTLLLDPGRIKRGVAQNLSLGPALMEGQQYAIEVAGGWPAANGQSAVPRFEKTFAIGAPLRSLPSTNDWQISLPKAGTRDPIFIIFDRPFDRVQTPNSLSLRGDGGVLVGGQVSMEQGETAWSFVPDQPWRVGAFELQIDARLEDVAGNNFRDTLDHALGTDTQKIDQIVLPVMITEPEF